MSSEAPTGNAAEHVDLLFFGPIFCDLIFTGVDLPAPGEEVYAHSFALSPGGSANRAVAAARLGARTVLLSQLGDDAIGAAVEAMLSAEPGLDLSWLLRTPGYQTPISVSLAGPHERSFITYEEDQPPGPFITYEEDQPPGPWPENGPTIGAVHVSAQRAMPAWVSRLRSEGTTVFGGVGWDATGEWSASLLERLADIDVLVVNDLEAAHYTNADTDEDAARLLGRYVDIAVITRGSGGVIAFERSTGRLIDVAAVAVEALDQTGAGDVFVGSLMVTESLDWSFEDRLKLAGLSASLSVRAIGGAASAPRLDEIEEFLTLERPDGDWTTVLGWTGEHSCSTATNINRRNHA